MSTHSDLCPADRYSLHVSLERGELGLQELRDPQAETLSVCLCVYLILKGLNQSHGLLMLLFSLQLPLLDAFPQRRHTLLQPSQTLAVNGLWRSLKEFRSEFD